jgi:hypothetical protein
LIEGDVDYIEIDSKIKAIAVIVRKADGTMMRIEPRTLSNNNSNHNNNTNNSNNYDNSNDDGISNLKSSKGEIILCAGAISTPKILAKTLYYQQQQQLQQPPAAVKSGSDDGNSCNHCYRFPLQDHPIVPLIYYAPTWYRPWYNSCNINNYNNNKNSNNNNNHPSLSTATPLPANGVHGWLHLTATGELYTNNNNNINNNNYHNSDQQQSRPVLQVMIIDGHIAHGLLSFLIPLYPTKRLYMKYIRPVLVMIAKWLSQLCWIQWILRQFLFVMINLVQPTSQGEVVIKINSSTAPAATTTPPTTPSVVTAEIHSINPNYFMTGRSRGDLSRLSNHCTIVGGC